MNERQIREFYAAASSIRNAIRSLINVSWSLEKLEKSSYIPPKKPMSEVGNPAEHSLDGTTSDDNDWRCAVETYNYLVETARDCGLTLLDHLNQWDKICVLLGMSPKSAIRFFTKPATMTAHVYANNPLTTLEQLLKHVNQSDVLDQQLWTTQIYSVKQHGALDNRKQVAHWQEIITNIATSETN